MWVFVVIGYLLLVGLAAWFGGGAVMTVAAGGFVLAVALWLLDGLLADLLRGPLRWLAKPFRALLQIFLMVAKRISCASFTRVWR